jgi:hypothetical protein
LNKSNSLEINLQKKKNFNKIFKKFNKLADDEIYLMYNKIFSKTDLELNELSYKDALKSDKRNYSEFYFSLLRTKHIIFFSFNKKLDFNSRAIKILLFFFNFISSLFVNSLFFTDNSINKIYYEGGKYDFLYNLPQILYSTIISAIINILIKLFSLIEKNYLTFRNDTSKKNVIKESEKLTHILKTKFLFFFILYLVFLVLI